MVLRNQSRNRLVSWPITIAFAVMLFLFMNGVGWVAKMFHEPPYQSLGVQVVPSNNPICEKTVDDLKGSDWCVIELRNAIRSADGRWFVDVTDAETGDVRCSGNGPINYRVGKTSGRRSLIMSLSGYSGREDCNPTSAFTVRTVRKFNEPIELFGFAIGWMRWAVDSPVSDPVAPY